MSHTFRVTLDLAGATGERFQLMEALVDTGASDTWIPRDVLEGLGVDPVSRRLIPVPGLLNAVA